MVQEKSQVISLIMGLLISQIISISFLKARTDVFVVEQNCPYPEVDGKDLQSYHMFKQENGEIIAYLRIFLPQV